MSNFRIFHSDDAVALIAILQQNVPMYFAQAEVAEFADYLRKHGDTYFTISHENEIVGGAGYVLSKNATIGSITWIFFAPAAQGLGLGRAAIAHFSAIFKNISTLTTISVRTSQLVYPFFEKMGFVLLYTKKDYWAAGFDLYYMEKP